jgi:7-cyano-7-deazaguanine synthase
MPEQAILLLSGGMDSTTLLYQLRRTQPETELHTVSIDYGQRHRIELDFAEQLSGQAGAASHRVLPLDLTSIGGSPLTDPNLDVPAAKADAQIDTVVPFRNMLFVTLAAACGETLGAHDIYLSPVRDDYAAYRDCRREFYDSLQSCLCLGASKDGEFRIHTPLINHSKVEVVAMGLNLAVPFAQTHTCYEGWRPACGVCDACSERRSAFAANDSVDPLEYETGGQSAP